MTETMRVVVHSSERVWRPVCEEPFHTWRDDLDLAPTPAA